MEDKENTEFEKEFLKLISPVSKWEGSISSLEEIFKLKIAEYGITQNQAESLLGMQKRTLEGILDKSAKRVDVVNLLKLGQFLGLDTTLLINAYVKDVSPDVASELEDTKKKSFILSKFDIKNLFKAGFLKDKNDYKAIEERIKKYFGLENIYDYPNKHHIPAFSKTKKSESSLMREFWVRSAVTHFEKLNNPNKYDRDVLVDLIPKIKPYTMNIEKGLRIVSQALYNCGVTVIYQQHLPTTQVRGATFVINGKPCIALTDLNKNYATLWFALIHELHHVLYDFEEIKSQVFHLTGETDLFLLQENKADEFSREYLFSYEQTKYISSYIDNAFIVEQYATKCQIHPSLIYNFYCYDMNKNEQKNYWGRFKHLLPKIELAIKDFNTNTLDKESIDETVKYLNEKVFNF